MNMLVDLLPETVNIDGAEVPINTDFRISILYELLIQDDELTLQEKIANALELYYPIIPDNASEAVEKIIWFYSCGKPPRETTRNTEDENQEDPDDAESGNPIYSFEHDADYIYAAFLSQYGVDLQDAENLHWWKFRAMFKALEDTTEFVKIMGYRSMKITSKMSKEQRAFYKKMQAIHALPVSNKVQEENDKLIEALRNGGDLTGIV